MAYSTGSAANTNALYDALITFLNANGWSTTETVTTRDKVLHSTGSDAKKSMYARLTKSTEAGTPFKSATTIHNAFPHILVRGYQYWNSGTGYNEFGNVGPYLTGGEQESGTGLYWHHVFDKVGASFPYGGQATKVRSGMNGELVAATTGISKWDEIRRAINAETALWKITDFITEDLQTVSAISSSPTNCNIALVHDAATNTSYAYVLSNITALADQFIRINLDTKEVVRRAAPIWSAAALQSAGALTWDGGDYIYAIRGGGTTDFHRYSISGNSWTAMTVATVARATTVYAPLVYLPASATGLAEDIILTALAASTTTFYRYNVTSNNWTTWTSPLASGSSTGTGLMWDGKKYLYVCTPNGTVSNFYRAPMDAPGLGTFVALGALSDTTRSFTYMDYVGHMPCRVRSSESYSITYWFIGDADSVSVITKINGRVYWSHFGAAVARAPQGVMKTTGSASAGHGVTVNVDSSADYAVGNYVLIMDSASANVERRQIQAIPSGTSITVNLTNSYATGTLIGADPNPFVLTGDSQFAVMLLDKQGFKTDPVFATYYAVPETTGLIEDAVEARDVDGGRGYLNFNRVILHSPMPELAATFEKRGTLDGVLTVIRSVYPAPQSEEVVRIGANQYLAIYPHENSKQATTNYLMLFGPID